MVRRPTGQLAGQPVGRNRLKGQAFGSVPFAFTKAVVSTTERVASVIAWHSSSPLKLANLARNSSSQSSSQTRGCAALRAESLWLCGDV